MVVYTDNATVPATYSTVKWASSTHQPNGVSMSVILIQRRPNNTAIYRSVRGQWTGNGGRGLFVSFDLAVGQSRRASLKVQNGAQRDEAEGGDKQETRRHLRVRQDLRDKPKKRRQRDEGTIQFTRTVDGGTGSAVWVIGIAASPAGVLTTICGVTSKERGRSSIATSTLCPTAPICEARE